MRTRFSNYKRQIKNEKKWSVFDMEGKQYVLDLGKPSPVDPFIEFPKMRYIGIKKELYNGLLEPGKIYTILEEKVYYHYTYYGILGGIGRIYNSTDFEFTNEVLSPMEYAVCKSIVFIKDEIEKAKEKDRTVTNISIERIFNQQILDYFKAQGFKVNISIGCGVEITTFSWE